MLKINFRNLALIVTVLLFSWSTWATEISVMTWNIYKGSRANWSELLEKEPVDILALQEVTSDPQQVLLPLENSLGTEYVWVLNPAWIMSDGYATGTMTVANNEIMKSQLLLSNYVEPIAATPKSMIVSDHLIPACGLVRVVNLHMINFNLGAAYEDQLRQLDSYIKDYSGPVIVMGDFNSWNIFRYNTMIRWSEEMGLEHIQTERFSWLVLDHIFFKRLKLKEAVEIPTSLSDHNALKAHFSCE